MKAPMDVQERKKITEIIIYNDTKIGDKYKYRLINKTKNVQN